MGHPGLQGAKGGQPEARKQQPAAEFKAPPAPPLIVKMRVDKGDTLESLSKACGLPVEKLVAANGGRQRMREGDVLRFALPLPRDRASMLRFLSHTRTVMEAAEARQATAAQSEPHTRAVPGEGSLELGQAVHAQLPPRPPPTALQASLLAALYLAGVAAKGAAVADGRGPARVDAYNSSAYTGTPPDDWLARQNVQSREPAWLALDEVYYALMAGTRQPVFRLRPGQPTWLAWEDRGDLLRFLDGMAAGGQLEDRAAARVQAVEPLDFLTDADANSRTVAFVPRGVKVPSGATDGEVLEVLRDYTLLLPRAEAESILARRASRASPVAHAVSGGNDAGPGPGFTDWVDGARRGATLADVAASVDGSVAEAGIYSRRGRPRPPAPPVGSGPGPASKAAAGPACTGPAWWEALPCVFVPEADLGQGGAMGFITADLADGGPRDAAVIAFEARRDAEAAAWAWAAAQKAVVVSERLLPIPPAELKKAAAAKGLRVVVFRAGQLPLRPGLSADQLAGMFVLFGRGN
ncbi:hypothetical protein WJX81_006459 [Elliptochloris bilobata]|uniref:LysM domain-containing protein n=1 Tax=Elliptochloris bilobata TaxID=381761 RepID=A0AAW1QYC5_9CHLO